MKVFQLSYQQLETKTIHASSIEEAQQHAREFAKLNPSVKILQIIEFDLNTFNPPVKNEAPR